jgi:hypothetical protein
LGQQWEGRFNQILFTLFLQHNRDNPAHQDRRAQQDHKDRQGSRVHPEPQDCPEHRESGEYVCSNIFNNIIIQWIHIIQVQNIVHWTEECFLKMERGDKTPMILDLIKTTKGRSSPISEDQLAVDIKNLLCIFLCSHLRIHLFLHLFK